MEHELTFTNVRGLVGAYEMLAQACCPQSCEIDLDQLRLTFTTHFPLSDAIRNELNRAPGLIGARVLASRAPVFQFPAAVAADSGP